MDPNISVIMRFQCNANCYNEIFVIISKNQLAVPSKVEKFNEKECIEFHNWKHARSDHDISRFQN